MDSIYQNSKIIHMGDDGSGDDIKIPSVFVDYETGITLKVRTFVVHPQRTETLTMLLVGGDENLGGQHCSCLALVDDTANYRQGTVVSLDLGGGPSLKTIQGVQGEFPARFPEGRAGTSDLHPAPRHLG